MAKLYFGGSFNPIHAGHLICSRWVAEAKGFDTVVLVPSAQPPHKPGHADLAAPHHRLAMCRAATEGVRGFEVNDLELRRSGPSYTIDTVRQLRGEGAARVAWLIGADMACILPSWHEAEALLEEIQFVIIARPGWVFDWQTLPPAFQSLQSQIVTAPLIDMRATLVRQRVGAGQPIDWLTPPPVIEYIRAQGLYRS